MVLLSSCSGSDKSLADEGLLRTVHIKQKFKYNISNSIEDFDVKKLNENLSKQYQINSEFIDSIDIDDLKIFIVNKSDGDTIFNSIGNTEVQVDVNNYGFYDLILIPTRVTLEDEIEYFSSDTIKIINFINLFYKENWSEFTNSNNGNWTGSYLSGISSQDEISSLKKSIYKKTFENFDTCNELEVEFEYVIDQNNRVSEQTLISRPFFDVNFNQLKKASISSGFDNRAEKISFRVNNLKEVMDIDFIKHHTLVKSGWKLSPGSTNTDITNDSLFKIAYDTLSLLGYPNFNKITSNSSTSSPTSPEFFNQNLYYKILNTELNQSLSYGIKNGRIELDGDSIRFDGTLGDNEFSLNIKNNRPNNSNITPFRNLDLNNLRFNLTINSMKITCY